MPASPGSAPITASRVVARGPPIDPRRAKSPGRPLDAATAIPRSTRISLTTVLPHPRTDTQARARTTVSTTYSR
jgi:hypothetical protein